MIMSLPDVRFQVSAGGGEFWRPSLTGTLHQINEELVCLKEFAISDRLQHWGWLRYGRSDAESPCYAWVATAGSCGCVRYCGDVGRR